MAPTCLLSSSYRKMRFEKELGMATHGNARPTFG
jgi:hypothetical protein